MAINIQEILHPSDSNAIKFEKINYNFDQIVANGGGPTGQKGAVGQQGNPGPQGQKGEKGDTGPQGLTGATTSRWKVIPAPLNLPTKTYSILKPKLEGDLSHPTVFLGDQTFDETQNLDGYEFNSTLTLGKHAVGNSGSSELLTFWHGANDVDPTQLSGAVITCEDYTQLGTEYTGAGVQYKLAPSFNSGNVLETQFMINMDRFVIGDGTRVEFENVANGTSTFRAPKSNLPADEAGLIRFNGSVFQGSSEVANAPGTYEWVDFCMAPCGQGGGYSISLEDGSDLTLDANGYVTGNSVSFDPLGDANLDSSGQDWDGSGLATTTTTATPETTTTTAAPATTTTTAAPATTTTTAAPATTTTTLATFDCGDAQLVADDGTEGTIVTGSVNGLGSLGPGNWNPQFYTVNVSTYQHSVTVPGGYSNAGQNISCDATGVNVTTPTTQGPSYASLGSNLFALHNGNGACSSYSAGATGTYEYFTDTSALAFFGCPIGKAVYSHDGNGNYTQIGNGTWATAQGCSYSMSGGIVSSYNPCSGGSCSGVGGNCGPSQ